MKKVKKEIVTMTMMMKKTETIRKDNYFTKAQE